MSSYKKYLSLVFAFFLILPCLAFSQKRILLTPVSSLIKHLDYGRDQLCFDPEISSAWSGSSFLLFSNFLKKYDLEKSGYGYLKISCYPYADIEIDGKQYGEVPPYLEVKLPEGKHKIRFILSKLDREKTIEVELLKGERKKIHGKFKLLEHIKDK